MSDFRSLVLRGSSASNADLAKYRDPSTTSIESLVNQVKEAVKFSSNTNPNNNNNNNPSVNTNNEYETGCALRFISRCMVASDDPSGRDQDAIVPRDDLKLNNGEGGDISVQSFSILATLFSEFVSQSSTGLIAIDGLQRLIQSVFVLVDQETNNTAEDRCASSSSSTTTTPNNSNQNNTKLNTSSQQVIARKEGLFKIIESVFLDLRVQELPTMSRRNAFKILSWVCGKSYQVWSVAIECCMQRIREESNNNDREQQDVSSRRATSSESLHLQSVTFWMDALNEALTEERDPVNVLALFNILISVHDFLEQNDKSFIKHIASKLVFSETDRFVDANDDDSAEQQKQENEEMVEIEQELYEVTEKLFQTSASYFPLQFAPAPGSSVKKETLILKLHQVMSSSLFVSFAIPQVLHKLQSATSTVTATYCLDVLEKGIESWKKNLTGQQHFYYSPHFCQQACRRLLRELFPFFRAYISSNVAGESEAVASRVVSTLSAAASAYDLSYQNTINTNIINNNNDFSSLLKNCSTLRKIMTVLPNPNPNCDSEAVFLDASLIHALGRNSPLLSLIFAATVLPVVATEEKRVALAASVFAVLEMNCAPEKNSSSTFLGDSNSSAATSLRDKVNTSFFTDEKSRSTLVSCVETSIATASKILSSFSSSQPNQQQLIRASADIVASCACLSQRNIFEKEITICEPLQNLLKRWKSDVVVNSQHQESHHGFSSAISSAVSVCLVVKPSLCQSTFVPFVNDENTNNNDSLLKSASTALNDVLCGAASKFPNPDSVDILTRSALELRQMALLLSNKTNNNNNTTNLLAMVDRLCLSPLASIVVDGFAFDSKQSEEAKTKFVKTLLLLFASSSPPQEQHQQYHDAVIALPMLCELMLSATGFTSSSQSIAIDSKNNTNTSFRFLSALVSKSFSEFFNQLLPQAVGGLIEESTQQLKQKEETVVSSFVAPLGRIVACFILASSYSSNSTAADQIIAETIDNLQLSDEAFSEGSRIDFAFFKAVVCCNLVRLTSTLIISNNSNNNNNNNNNNNSEVLQEVCKRLTIPSLNELDSLQNNENIDRDLYSSPAIFELLRKPALEKNTPSRSCCGKKQKDDSSSSSCCVSWELQVADVFLRSILENPNQESSSTFVQLRRCTSFLEAAKLFSNSGDAQESIFDQILILKHKEVLKLIRLNNNNNNNNSNEQQQQQSANEDSAQQKRQLQQNSASSKLYQEDCLTWLEWLLLLSTATTSSSESSNHDTTNSNNSTRIAALEYLVFTEPKGSVLLFLADMIAQHQQSTSDSSNENIISLQHRLRPLKILTHVGKNILELCMDKDSKAKQFEASVRPLIPIIVKKVQSCLQDRKRLVRAVAGDLRHYWLLIPKQ